MGGGGHLTTFAGGKMGYSQQKESNLCQCILNELSTVVLMEKLALSGRNNWGKWNNIPGHMKILLCYPAL